MSTKPTPVGVPLAEKPMKSGLAASVVPGAFAAVKSGVRRKLGSSIERVAEKPEPPSFVV